MRHFKFTLGVAGLDWTADVEVDANSVLDAIWQVGNEYSGCALIGMQELVEIDRGAL